MDIYQLVHQRYSVREYKDQAVPEEAIRRVLDAARLAPSACNFQPWHFYVVRAAETRKCLFPSERQAWVAAAPVIVVACSRPAEGWTRGYDSKPYASMDVAIAMEHLILAATAEGLGTCWVCSFDPALFRAVLSLPAELEPVAATPLGYAATAPGPRERKSLDEVVTWM